MMLNIGSGADYREGYVNLERFSDSSQHIGDTEPPDVKGDAHHLPFKDETFNRVEIIHTLEHLERPLDCLLEIKRVVKDGKFVQIEVPDVDNIHSERRTHWYSWTSWSMENICRRAGLDIQHMYVENTSNGPTLGVVAKG